MRLTVHGRRVLSLINSSNNWSYNIQNCQSLPGLCISIWNQSTTKGTPTMQSPQGLIGNLSNKNLHHEIRLVQHSNHHFWHSWLKLRLCLLHLHRRVRASQIWASWTSGPALGPAGPCCCCRRGCRSRRGASCRGHWWSSWDPRPLSGNTLTFSTQRTWYLFVRGSRRIRFKMQQSLI